MMRLIAIVLLFAAGDSMAQASFQSNASGGWSSATSWQRLSGSDADGIPDANDDVTVKHGHTITVASGIDAACNNLTLAGTGRLDINQSNRTLTVHGTMTMNGTSTVVAGNSGIRLLNLLGDFIIPSGQIGIIDNVDITQEASKKFTILGELKSTHDQGDKSIGNVFINSGGTSSGKWTFDDDELWNVQSLTIYDGPVGQALIDGTRTGTINVAGDLSVIGVSGGQKSKLGNVNLTVNGKTSVEGWLLFAFGNDGDKRFNDSIKVANIGTWDNEVGEDPFVNGHIVNMGNWPSARGGPAIYTVEAAGPFTYSGGLPITMSRLVINQATVTNLTNLELEGDLDQGLQVGTSAIFNNGSGGYLRLTCTSDAISGLGTVDFSAASNTVEYGAVGTQNIFPTTYHKLICSNSGAKTQGAGTVTVNSEFHILGAGTFYNAGTNTLNGAASLFMTGNSELQLAKTGVDLPELTGTSNSLQPGTDIFLTGSGVQRLKSDAIYFYQNIRILTGSADLSNVNKILGTMTIVGGGAITSIPASGLTVVGTYDSNSSGNTIMTGGNLTVGSIVLDGSGTFNYTGRTVTINGTNGAWTNNGIGTLTSTNGTVVFATGTGQKIGGNTATTFTNLTINNSNGVSINTVSPTVSGTLNLVSGSLITGTNKVVVATVTRTSGFVQGNLQKPVATGTNVTIGYELGAGTTYSPVTLTFASVSASGTGFVVGATAGDHPQILSANIEPSTTVNRYYTIMRVGNVTFTTLSATLNFVSGDVDAGFSPATDGAIKGYNANTEIWKSTPIGARTATSVQFINVPSANFPESEPVDFQIGKRIIVTGFFNRLTGGPLNWHSASTWINNRDGTITLTSGSANVTGVGTFFNLQLVPGDQIVLQTSPSAAPLVVQSITDGTHLVLTAPYVGTTKNGGYGRLRVPNNNTDSVVIGNPQFTGSTDIATTIELTANATVHTLAINEPPNGRTTPQVLTHIGTSQLNALQVSVNQPTGATTDFWNINAGSAIISADLTIGSANSTNTRIARVVMTTGTLTVGGDLFFRTSGNGSEGTAVLNVGSGRVNLAGTLQSIGNRATLTMGTTAVFNFNSTKVPQSLDLPDSSPDTFIYSNIESNNTTLNGLQLGKSMDGTNITGNFRVLSGKLQLPATGSPSLTGGANQTFELASGATLEMLGNNSQDFPSGYQTYTLGTGSTVIYAQTGNVTLPARPTSYGHLVFSSSEDFTISPSLLTVQGDLTIGNSTATPLLQGSGLNALTVMGNVLINTGATLSAAAIPLMYVHGNWTNNGTFTPGTGLGFVEFGGNGAVQPQTIGGTTADTFYNIRVNTNDNTDLVRLLKDVSVSNRLSLIRGGLEINGNVLSITNPATTAVGRTAPGYIKSETTALPYSRLRRTINTATGSFLYPFGKSAATADYVPFTCEVTNAGGPTGTFEVATYATAPNNTPFPEGVTNVNTSIDASGDQVVDRFWILTRAGFTTTPVATMTFTVTAAEAEGVEGGLRAQRWTPANIWESPIPGQINNTSLSVTVPSVTSLSPWTLASEFAPLPVELLKFEARPVNGVVELKWMTATEIDNMSFDVERSRDGEEFTSIGSIDGAGNSITLRKYNFTDTYPLSGSAYYRLRQTDFGGQSSYSQVLRVHTTGSVSIRVWPNPSGGDELNINWRDGEPGGNVFVRLWTQTGASAFKGQLSLDENLNAKISVGDKLSPGLYLLEVQTADGVQRMRWVVR
jgi:hypothetical protein